MTWRRDRNDAAVLGKFLICEHSLMLIFSKLAILSTPMGRHDKLTHWEMSRYFNRSNSQMPGGSVLRAGHAYNLKICRHLSFPNSAGKWRRLWQLVILKVLRECIPQMLEGSSNKSIQWSIVSSKRQGKVWGRSTTDWSRLLLILQRIIDNFLKCFRGTVALDNWGTETFSSQRLLRLTKFEKTEEFSRVALSEL